jgi:uncharacterized repeat protein (TIGR01451 family)
MGKKSPFVLIPILLAIFLLLSLNQSLSQAALPVHASAEGEQKIPHPGARVRTQLSSLTPNPSPGGGGEKSKAETIPFRGLEGFDSKRIHPELVKALSSAEASEQMRIIIEWGGRPYEEVIQAALARSDSLQASRSQARSLVVTALKSYADERSKALRSALQEAELLGQAAQVRSFWVSPIIAAKASPALIETLSQREDVVQIRLDEGFYLEEATFTQQASAEEMSWNLELIGVDYAQQQLGLDGSGVVVANLDTGVDWQHPALLKKYRGYNPRGPAQHVGNWFVVTDEPYQVPGDGNGHGTHTMGTIVGDDEAGNRTGVAPGARWIAVKLFNNQGYTYESWVHAAFEWIIAPAGDPSLAPDMVNCSWGAEDGSDDRYRSDILALRSAGILPVFSAGNEGPNSSSIGSPASLPESFAVGAVSQDRIIALFSSRGPSPWQEIKPEVSAPGVNILSTYPGNGYATASGTSMAAPHATGLAALLLQGNPRLSPDGLEEIMRTTAYPLGNLIPNNDTGWGMINAYAAGLKANQYGELVGAVRRAGDFGPVPYPILSARPIADPAQTLTIAGDANGTYTFALRPGRYDLNVSAFGFVSATFHNIEIITETKTTFDLLLSAAPSGFLNGRVTDLQSGAPLSATLSVKGTRVTVQTNPATGRYAMPLPEGTWKVDVYAPAHRIGHITPTITASMSYTFNLELLPAPDILLVDAGRWYYGSQIRYFREALDILDYPYRELPIRSIGLGGTPDERPVQGSFSPYDIVIWSDPRSSPGWIGSGDVITDFLKTGGSLLLSGEDTLYLDGGGSFWSIPEPYMVRDIGIQFSDEGNLSPLSGTPRNILEGLQLALNVPDSSQQQTSPDQALIRSPLRSQAALNWSDQTIGGITSGICQPFRAFWMGFGFEGTGPLSSRVELLKRVIEWFELPPQPYGIHVQPSSAPMIGAAGSVVTQTIQLNSTGVITDQFNLSVNGGPWPLDLELPNGSHVQDDTSLTLAACGQSTITATVTIPAGQLRDARSIYNLSFTSQNDPTISAAITLTAKTHAPVLLVEQQIWYKNIEPYTQTLTSLGLPYDIFRSQTSTQIPALSLLQNYPVVIWTTGYNWYNPVSSAGAKNLTQYLDQGGRLLLSSQDLLDLAGESQFVQERLGVMGFTLSVTPTEVTAAQDQPAVQNQPFGTDLGLWDLTFPYNNWGDGIKPAKNTSVVLEDQNPFPVGVSHAGSHWRSSFFSFPLETLDRAAHHILLSQALLWISPFGESRLQAPPAALSGAQVPITLTLQLAHDQFVPGLRAVLPLLPQTSLVPASLQGPWEYDAAGNQLTWNGSLAPGEKISLKAVLQLAENIPPQTILPLQAYLSDIQGLVVVAETPLHIGVPWLRLWGRSNLQEATAGETNSYTFTLRNDGVIASTTALTMTIPTGMRLITETLSATSGQFTLQGNEIRWNGDVQPQTSLVIQYNADIITPKEGSKLATSALAVNASMRKKAWVTVWVPARYYYPLIMK